MHGNRKLASDGARQVRLILDASREAERVLERDAQLHPNYADIRHRLGLLRLARRDYEGAQREFEDALGIHPGYRAAHYALRLTWLLQGRCPDSDLPKAGAEWAAREEVCWSAVDQAYRLRLAEKDPAEALRGLDADWAPELGTHYLALFALRDGAVDVARSAFEDAAARSQIAGDVLRRLGLVPWSEESEERAYALSGGLVWSPLAVDLYTYIGRIYASHGLREEALRSFDHAYLVFPREAQHELYLSELASSAGEENEALAHLQRSVSSDPECTEAQIALGFEYASQGFADQARTAFRRAVELAPNYADVHYNLALLYVSSDEHDAALQEFAQALRLNPSYLPARHSMAALLCRLGRFADGLREYETILRQGFQSADMLAQMGRAALALDRPDSALHYLERAKFQNPEYHLTYYYLGQTYRRKGLRNKARSAWRRYLDGAAEWQPQPPPGEIPEDDEIG
ncbi:MAG: tetratricopeptide repeat protein [Candidatus Eisenbacteria bacterium]|nr:tetratricopeptide repeat protein [Candidatus Eisenbacteria bacterium]